MVCVKRVIVKAPRAMLEERDGLWVGWWGGSGNPSVWGGDQEKSREPLGMGRNWLPRGSEVCSRVPYTPIFSRNQEVHDTPRPSCWDRHYQLLTT